jgi:hypothetical protein
MNLYRSLRNHENPNIYEGLPPQGLSEARRGKEVFYDTSTDLPGVNRSAAGELIAARSVGVLTSITMHGTCDFHRESFPLSHYSSFAARLIATLQQGLMPVVEASPKCDRGRAQ